MRTPIELNTVQERIKKNALQVGNKAANLDELNLLCQSESNVSVPVYYSLTDMQIKTYLDHSTPEWRDLWVKFQAEQGHERAEITPAAKATLAELRALIESAFSQKDNTEMRTLMAPFLTQERDHSLMVRSTGEEDSVDLANPGGNISIAAVNAALPEDVCHAIGLVVASYFSEKSLNCVSSAKGTGFNSVLKSGVPGW